MATFAQKNFWKNPRFPARARGVGLMAMVRVEPGEYIDTALRRFKKATQKADILRDLRRHEFYTGRSARRRRKSAAAQRRRATAGLPS